MPSVLPLVVRTSFRFNGRIHNDRFVTFLVTVRVGIKVEINVSTSPRKREDGT